MKQKKLKLSVLLLGLGLIAQAQQAATATGGDASGSGGTVAYSIGQIWYTTNTEASGSVASGVQQAYEISIVLGTENHLLSIDLQVYPNPTTGHLHLKVEGESLNNLTYQLFDLSGRLIEHQKIASTTETIQMENLPSAVYFLKVTNDNQSIKTFKIIKY